MHGFEHEIMEISRKYYVMEVVSTFAMIGCGLFFIMWAWLQYLECSEIAHRRKMETMDKAIELAKATNGLMDNEVPAPPMLARGKGTDGIGAMDGTTVKAEVRKQEPAKRTSPLSELLQGLHLPEQANVSQVGPEQKPEGPERENHEIEPEREMP